MSNTTILLEAGDARANTAKALEKTIKAQIRALTTMFKRTDEAVHQTAVNCIQHAEMCGDARSLQALVNVLPKSWRRKALLFWVSQVSPIFVSEDGTRCGILKPDDTRYNPYDIETAVNIPFTSLKDVDEELHIDLVAALKAKDKAEAKLKALLDSATLGKQIERLLKQIDEATDEKVRATAPQLRLVLNTLAA
jgi:hypothetical protein